MSAVLGIEDRKFRRLRRVSDVSVASPGVILPIVTAFVTAAMRSAASRGAGYRRQCERQGSILRAGYIRSWQSRSAVGSPSCHLDGLLRQGSAWPSSSASHAMVAAFRKPRGRPRGLKCLVLNPGAPIAFHRGIVSGEQLSLWSLGRGRAVDI
jgi:hypothetical protein